jgi:hypothetical protein
LLRFNPRDKGNSFPCPRIWVKVAHLNDLPDSIKAATIIGALGEEIGMDYLTFLRNFNELPSIKDIKADPQVAPLPKRLDAMHMLTLALANVADFGSVTAFATYLKRVAEEWQVLFFKETERLHPELSGTQPFTEWRLKSGNLYT